MNEIILKRILSKANIDRSIRHVVKKNTKCGYDGMFPRELPQYWAREGNAVCEKIYKSTYEPQPSLCVMIRRPNGKERRIEIPCVIDRMLQYAVYRVMIAEYNPLFHVHSYGFRPGRNADQALRRCLKMMNDGNTYIADIDIASFFDTVNHDLVMELVERDIRDENVLHLIRGSLKPRVNKGFHFYQNVSGLPQGSPLSPLLANIYLHPLDRYIDDCGFRFVRYADDIMVLCRCREDAQRAVELVTSFLQRRLQLSLNEEKTGISEPECVHFLGFAFRKTSQGRYVLSIDKKIQDKMIENMKTHIKREDVASVAWWDRIGSFNRGWINYYRRVPADQMRRFIAVAEEIQGDAVSTALRLKETPYDEGALLESTTYISLGNCYEAVERKRRHAL